MAKGRKIPGWMKAVIGGLAVLFFCLAGLVAYGRTYQDRFFPGVKILGVSLGGLTRDQADQSLEIAINRALEGGVHFFYHNKPINIDVTAVGADPDTSRDLIHVSLDQALDRAFAFGRGGPWVQRIWQQLYVRIVGVTFPAPVAIDRERLFEELTTTLQNQLVQTKDASFIIHATSQPPVIQIEPERRGVVLSADAALDVLERQAQELKFEPIPLNDRSLSPSVTVADLEPLIPQVQAYLARPQLVFSSDATSFPVPSDVFADWIVATGTRGDLRIAIDPTKFAHDLPKIAEGVEREAKNGSLVIQGGKIMSFVSGVQGVHIDTQATLKRVMDFWPASSTIPLVVETTEGKLTGEDPERLGIRDLLGIGTSNFSGSPVNRRKNIAHGAALVNGTIIQDGEIFSLLKTLGPIDGEHQWLPELVIKGNETKPEYGGGLCQIGTTTFRGSLASGLPIVERQNHSYRVRYYEPAGTDATIYDPKPDFRFLNDTGHAILITTSIKGDDLRFEFWGTKDGRRAEQTVPKVSNVVAPPPTKIVETLTLPPGQKKCTETAHAGADAEFTYTVTLPSGEVKKEVFRSHYRPWQAVCLLGVEKLSQPASTSTQDLTP